MSLAILESKMHQFYTKIVLGSVPEDVYFPCFPGLSQVDWKKCPTKIHQDNYSSAFFMIVLTLFDMNKIVLFY